MMDMEVLTERVLVDKAAILNLFRVCRGQTDRGYKKTEPDPDICNLLFVSFKRNRIFQNCYPLRY